MNLSIRDRIWLVVGLLLFLFFVTSSIAHLLTQRVGDDVAALARIDMIEQRAAEHMAASAARFAGSIAAYALEGDPAHRARAAEAAAGFERTSADLESLARSSRQRSMAREAAEQFAALAAAGRTILERVDTGGAPLAVHERPLLAEFDGRRARLEALLHDELFPEIQATRSQVEANVIDSMKFAVWYILSMTLLGLVVGTASAVVLSRGIVRPLEALTEGAEAIGRGNLEHRITAVSDDEIGQLADAFNRMAEQRQKTEDALRVQAHFDNLTQLPNRTLFQVRLDEAMDTARRVDRLIAIHALDLNNFKDINDTLGHPAGDALLTAVADRILHCVRKSDTVARLGGDEFAIIQTNMRSDSATTPLAARVISAISEPFDLDGERVYTGTSVGIAMFPHDGTSPEILMKNADLALYQAKATGGAEGDYRLYDPEMNEAVHARKSLELDIRQALDDDAFELAYQPQIDVASGALVGAEALVRWTHPERGRVSPGAFIPVAEQAGLVTRLTEIVLRKSCAQARAWRDAGLPDLMVSVNLSPADFQRSDIAELISATLRESGLDPRWLELEITEGMVMAGVDEVVVTLNGLHDLGVALAIDDFGTGFSSMSYLKRFPVDRLKIDQTFLSDVLSNREDASITEAIIKLAHSLDLRVVAEGIETAEQLAFLRARGCDEGQGYYIAKPLDADAFADFVTAYKPETLRRLGAAD